MGCKYSVPFKYVSIGVPVRAYRGAIHSCHVVTYGLGPDLFCVMRYTEATRYKAE
jgi:hypothetical protein